MEELCQQIQRLQERLEAFEGQQAQHPPDEPHKSEEDTDNENPFHHLKNNESSSSIERVCCRHPQQNVAPKSTNLSINIDISDFEGCLQQDEFIDWLHTVEPVFELKDIPDHKRVKLIAIKLKKHASIWWENLKRGSQGTQASNIVAETPAKVEKEASSSHPAQPNTQKCFKCQGFGHIPPTVPIGELSPLSEKRFMKSQMVKQKRSIVMKLSHNLRKHSSQLTMDNLWFYMVEKLGLLVKDLSHPYKLQWLQNGNEQFDKKAIHDGHANTYLFVKNGVQIKLTLLKPKDLLEKKDEDKALISRSTFQKLHQESRIACLLLLSKVNDATSPSLEEIRSLLEEFSNVVPDEIPHGLPIIRIDLKLEDEFSPTKGECTKKNAASMQKLRCSTANYNRPVQLCQNGHNGILNLTKIGVSVSVPVPAKLKIWNLDFPDLIGNSITSVVLAAPPWWLSCW
ncbi:hypothetical protein SLEP1_g57175 [Rubroshorea leprosula]|uniref:Retrotransposon gag domain-containing protein n=1 Tax=Rubroshorea leprosula TaxID=152421 RepID=A0AAV5MMV5_9ROSI|nr:hypothetical protein SLEP1_g57175 [Rubroshorea leprosula]